MKIDKSSTPLPSASIELATRSNKSAATASSNSLPENSISVSLGSTASQLNSMEKSMASTPMVDSKKVAEIKQAISEGRFKVNANVIADKLLDSVKSLINHQV